MESFAAAGLLVVVAVSGIVLFLLLRLLGDVRPQDYFGLSDLISGADFPMSSWAIAYRLLVPIGVGVGAGLLFHDSPVTAAAGGGTLGGFLVVWPAISRPILLDYRLRRAFPRLLLVYAMFVLSMASLTMVGGLLSVWLVPLVSSESVAPTARELLVGALGSILGAGLLAMFSALRRQQRR